MMSILDAAKAFEEGKAQFEEIMEREGCRKFFAAERYGEENSHGSDIIASGDNLEYMEYLLKQKNMAGRIQLIYADPPFFSKGKYEASFCLETEELGKSSVIKTEAYDDRWEQGMEEYLAMLAVRLFMMRELLSETGCIWVHLDWHVSHYVKLFMDNIFGAGNFINEVIWTYKSGGATVRSFARKHDTLLLYGKSRDHKFNTLKEKSYNRGFKPYRFKGVEEFCDETGWYTMVNMKDVWSIDMVGRTSSERTGYATQKPEKLMERIIAACSDEGDICADFFAGSGTLGAVCERTGRRWIMCDSGALSIAAQVERLGAAGGFFTVERCCDESLRRRVDIGISDDKIELLNYDFETGENCGKSRGEIEKYVKHDSLSTIRFWSVDTDFDGSIHRGKKLLSGKIRSFEGKPQKGKRISIMGYDVMGGRFSETIDI